MNITNNEKREVSIWRRLIPGLFLGFFVFLALVLIGDVRKMGDTLKQFRWEWFVPVLMLTTFNDGLRFIKWHFYVRQLGVTNVGWQESMRMFVGGFPLSVTPGKVGEALKGVWLNQASGLPVGSGVSVVVAERISDGLAVLVLSVFGVAAYPQYWPVFVFVLGGLLAAVVISQIPPLANWFLDLAGKVPVAETFCPRDTPIFMRAVPGCSSRLRRWQRWLWGALSWMGEGHWPVCDPDRTGRDPRFSIAGPVYFCDGFFYRGGGSFSFAGRPGRGRSVDDWHAGVAGRPGRSGCFVCYGFDTNWYFMGLACCWV